MKALHTEAGLASLAVFEVLLGFHVSWQQLRPLHIIIIIIIITVAVSLCHPVWRVASIDQMQLCPSPNFQREKYSGDLGLGLEISLETKNHSLGLGRDRKPRSSCQSWSQRHWSSSWPWFQSLRSCSQRHWSSSWSRSQRLRSCSQRHWSSSWSRSQRLSVTGRWVCDDRFYRIENRSNR